MVVPPTDATSSQVPEFSMVTDKPLTVQTLVVWLARVAEFPESTVGASEKDAVVKFLSAG